MVQRKALNKPSFNKASPSPFEALNSQSTNMKPTILSLDCKSKGSDLAKKMKKSRSFKRSTDLDNLKKCSLRRHQLPTDHQPPPKQQPPCSPVKQSPNYMKSTSSSEARKEQKQVLITKTPSKSVIESTSKRLFSSSSSSSKSVSRISSLSKVRNLTKAPSFKPAKKCSKTALCDVKRNTCSSTIKDSKFPNFLDLSPQGTSIMKVCPYNYCSLNGHRHNTSPPLKSFLCARRRMMKAQRTLNPVAASPCKVKPCLDDDQGKQEANVSDKEEKADFFLEIYAKKESPLTEMKLVEDVVVDECVYDVGSFDWESSDMELEEEGMICVKGFDLKDDDSTLSDQTKEDEIENLLDEGVVKKDDVNMEFLKQFLAEELSQDETIDCHEQLSDSDYDAYEESDLDQFFQAPSAAIGEEKTEEFSALNKETIVEDTFLIQDNENPGFAKGDCCDDEEESTEEDESKSDNKASGDVNKNLYNKGSNFTSMITITKGMRNRKEEREETKSFNPREPNFLEMEADLESEKVDLKHQEMDERRNSEEWMLDFALRKAVSDLAPARKRKVALLVAAFETVIPPPRTCEARLRPDFVRLQPCN